MGSVSKNLKKALVVMAFVVSIVVMNACNNQVCPAYSNVPKPEAHKNV